MLGNQEKDKNELIASKAKLKVKEFAFFNATLNVGVEITKNLFLHMSCKLQLLVDFYNKNCVNLPEMETLLHIILRIVLQFATIV